MLILIPRCFRGARKSAAVNWEPWSEFHISGCPKRNAACKAARQKAGLHGVGKLPSQHEAAEPVHDSHPVKEPPAQLKMSVKPAGACFFHPPTCVGWTPKTWVI